MLKKLILCLGLLALLSPSAGCNTTEPVIWSWPHHKRRIRTMLTQLHEFHEDIDRIVFDMESRPIETEY